MACGSCGRGRMDRQRRPALTPRQPVRLPTGPELNQTNIARIVPTGDPAQDPFAMTAERRRIDSLRRQAIRKSLGIG